MRVRQVSSTRPAGVLAIVLAVGGLGLVAACRSRAAPGAGALPPRRVVSLAPSLTEIAFAIGGGDRIVGVDDFVEFPPEATRLPKVGGLLNPSLERILALRPDLVLMVQSFRGPAERLGAAGVRTVVIPNESLADLDAAIGALGEALAARPEAERLRARIAAELRAVASSVAGRQRPSVVFVLDHRLGALTDLYVAGAASFLVQVIERAGGRSAFADVEAGAVRVGVEEVLRRSPDVILDATPEPDPADVWKALPALPAVRSGRVFSVAEHSLTVPGPRVGLIARRIAALLHPESVDGIR